MAVLTRWLVDAQDPDRPTWDQYRPAPTRASMWWQLALMVAVTALFWTPALPGQLAQDPPVLLVVDIVVGLGCYAIIGLRRRWPVPVAVVINAASIFSGFSGGPAYLSAGTVGTRRRLGEILLVMAVVFVSAVAFSMIQPVSYSETWWSAILTNLVYAALPLVVGVVVGARWEMLWTLRQRTLEAEAERDSQALAARREERTAVAREMHDVLAHRISQLSMHAGVLAFRDDLPADQLRQSVRLIQNAAEQAGQDLLDIVGVLSEDPGQSSGRGVDEIVALVQDARAQGQEVDLHLDLLDQETMPPPLAHAVYRSAQEALTNAGKHGGGGVRITITGDPKSGVTLRAVNPLGKGTRVPGAGLGLTGLAERVRLLDGRLAHGSVGEQFVLEVWLPWSGNPRPGPRTSQEETTTDS